MASAAPKPQHPPETAGATGSQAVLRAMSLLSAVGRGGSAGLGLSALAVQTGLTQPTARRLLLALATARMVEQDPASRRYRLGPEAFLLSTFASDRHGILAHAEASLQRLAEVSGDTALLTVQQDDRSICLARVEGSFPVRSHALLTGDRHPMGVGAGALAIFAALPEGQAEALFQRLRGRHGGLHQQVRDDVALARARGYALNQGHVVPGSWGLGVVVRWPDGRPAAALSLAAVESRMTETRLPELIALLRRETAAVEARLAALAQPERKTA